MNVITISPDEFKKMLKNSPDTPFSCDYTGFIDTFNIELIDKHNERFRRANEKININILQLTKNEAKILMLQLEEKLNQVSYEESPKNHKN